MPNANFEQQIKKSIEAFVEELSGLVRTAAVQSVTEAFGGQVAAASPGRRGRGGRQAAAPAARGGSRRKGQKRNPEALAQLVGQLFSAIKANPGLRMEQIAQGLKTSTQELALPAKKLIGDKKIKTKGQRRATKYFPA
jgi:hypothetical protein